MTEQDVILLKAMLARTKAFIDELEQLGVNVKKPYTAPTLTLMPPPVCKMCGRERPLNQWGYCPTCVQA